MSTSPEPQIKSAARTMFASSVDDSVIEACRRRQEEIDGDEHRRQRLAELESKSSALEAQNSKLEIKNSELATIIANQSAALSNKDAALADKDDIIAQYRHLYGYLSKE